MYKILRYAQDDVMENKQMCLGVPGKVVEMYDGQDLVFKNGKVDFGGAVKEINFSYVPEARLGDYVIVHAGFAISVLDEKEANEVFEYLRQMDGLGELAEENR